MYASIFVLATRPGLYYSRASSAGDYRKPHTFGKLGVMAYANSKTKQYLHIFVPTGIGLVGYVSFALFIMFLNQFSMIQQVLQLPQDLNVGRTITGWLDSILSLTLGQSRTETLVVGLFWGMVGLGVYTFLHGVARFISELDEDIDERRFVWPRGTDRARPLVQLIERSVFRVSVLVALLIFLFYPVAAVLRGPVLTSLAGSSKPLEYLVWFVAIVLSLHVSVVLLRLFAFRARLFG